MSKTGHIMTKKNRYSLYVVVAIGCLSIGTLTLFWIGGKAGSVSVEVTTFNPPIIVTSTGISRETSKEAFYDPMLNLESAFLAAPNWETASKLYTDNSLPVIEKMGMNTSFDKARESHPPSSLVKTILSAVKVSGPEIEAVFFQTAPYRIPENTSPPLIAVDCFKLQNGTWKIDKPLESTKLWNDLAYIAPSEIKTEKEKILNLAKEAFTPKK
jgi:hypothetical protein